MQDSRLYSFLDAKNNFTIHFLEGQKMIVDLVQTHNLSPISLNFYRASLLSTMHLLNFLKVGESIGFYIDSEEPYFRFKVEMSDNGNFRTLLLPSDFQEFPDHLNGVCRFTKTYHNKRPYSSVIKMQGETPDAIINEAFKSSYQTESRAMVAENADQSVMFTKLPAANVNMQDHFSKGLNEYILEKKKIVMDLFAKATDDTEMIVKYMEDNGLAYLGSKSVKLTCSCSKERMVTNLVNLHPNDLKDVFDNKPDIQITCDYCHVVYNITLEDVNLN